MLYWIEETTSHDGKKPQTNNNSYKDCYETIEDAIAALKEKHEFDVKYYSQRNILINEFVEDGLNSFYHMECGPYHKAFSSFEDLGNGFGIRESWRVDQDYYYCKAVIKQCSDKEDDPELQDTKNEFVKFLEEFLDKTRFQIVVVCGGSTEVPSRPFPYQVIIQKQGTNKKCIYDKIVSFYLYKVKGTLCVKMHNGTTSLQLIKTGKFQTTTWYENLPQTHSHYLYNEEQKECIKEKLLKKYLK